MSFSPFRNALLQRYRYDATDRVVALEPGPSAIRRFYSGNVLSNQLVGELRRSHVNAGSQLLGLREQQGGPPTLRLLGVQPQGSVLQVVGGVGQQRLAYTPHGEGAAPSLPGFNGEQPDPLTGNYLLGNGYRAYNPTLQRFHGPDSFSPFAGGGLNPYTYCLGDPVNRVDPSGHLSSQSWATLGLGALGMLFGGAMLASGGLAGMPVAAMVSGVVGIAVTGGEAARAVILQEESESGSLGVLGWVGLGVGAALLLAGVGKVALDRFRAVSRQVSAPEQLTAPQLPESFLEAPHSNAVLAQHARALVEPASLGPQFLMMRQGVSMARIVHMLGADDLTALASTSSSMRDLVYENLRSSSTLPRATNVAALWARYTRIGSGQIQGTLPIQLIVGGVRQTDLPVFIHQNGAYTRATLERVADLRRGLARQANLRARWGV